MANPSGSSGVGAHAHVGAGHVGVVGKGGGEAFVASALRVCGGRRAVADAIRMHARAKILWAIMADGDAGALSNGS